jgi:hypothetical protein
MANRIISEQDLARAEQMIDDGESVAATARETGISAQTLYKRFKRSADATPKGSKTKKTPQEASDEQLTNLFAKAGSAPAIPMMLWVGCDFCADHFATNGPKAAAQLVELSKDHPALRSVMNTVWRTWDEVAWSAILLTWVGVPLVHHVAPARVRAAVGPFMGIPRDGQPWTPTHTHEPSQNGDTPPPMDTPFGNLDISQLLATAEAFGIKVDPGMMGLVNEMGQANGAEPAVATEPEPDDSNDDEDGEVITSAETVAADTDTGE